MKKLLIAASFTALAATGAQAADIAAKAYTKAPPPVTVMNWTGFFIGIEGGYGWGRDTIAFPFLGTTTGQFSTNGGVAGGAIGYNWQPVGSSWLFGIEGNFDWANIKGSATCPGLIFTCKANIDQIYSGAGRIGYTWNSMMIYGKGGFAWTKDHYGSTVNATGAVFDSASGGQSGYILGAGVEYMFARSWSAKLEYDYYNFGNKTSTTFTPAGLVSGDVNINLSPTINVVKAGVNYHFNWGDPVVAKY
jgi:outer membrane immunogenic protein